MDRRHLFKDLLTGIRGSAVEVGTCWGHFAEFLAEHTTLDKIYCIDPYKVYSNEIYCDALNRTTQQHLDEKFIKVKEKLSKIDKIEMRRLNSEKASFAFTDETLMFVYIDANHQFSEVLKDLCFWWPKVAPTGIIAGDDVEGNIPHQDGNLFIEHQKDSFGLYGVRTALELFSKLVPSFKYQIVGNQFCAQKIP